MHSLFLVYIIVGYYDYHVFTINRNIADRGLLLATLPARRDRRRDPFSHGEDLVQPREAGATRCCGPVVRERAVAKRGMLKPAY